MHVRTYVRTPVYVCSKRVRSHLIWLAVPAQKSCIFRCRHFHYVLDVPYVGLFRSHPFLGAFWVTNWMNELKTTACTDEMKQTVSCKCSRSKSVGFFGIVLHWILAISNTYSYNRKIKRFLFHVLNNKMLSLSVWLSCLFRNRGCYPLWKSAVIIMEWSTSCCANIIWWIQLPFIQ